MENSYDVIIVGAGPAGLTAGLYTCRAKLSTLIIEKEVMGGELMAREMIENYPGYPDGIMGPELGSNMMTQVMNYGAEFSTAEVTGITTMGNRHVVKTSRGDYSARAIVLAGGSHPRKLGVPGEAEFADKGVFYCASCDGPKFAKKTVVVAGGGDSGITEALMLARASSKVIVVEMMPCLNATPVLQDRTRENSVIEVKCGFKVESIEGNGHVERVNLISCATNERSVLNAEGILVHIGIEPNTDFLRGTSLLNNRGQVIVDERMATKIPGIFAAGDIRQNSPWQISTAVGDGATAAIALQKYLNQLG